MWSIRPLRIGNQQRFLDRKMKIVITILISFCPGGGLLFEYRPCGTWTLQAYNTCAIFSLRCKLIGLECCIIMNSLNSCNFPVLVMGMCTIVRMQKKQGWKEDLCLYHYARNRSSQTRQAVVWTDQCADSVTIKHCSQSLTMDIWQPQLLVDLVHSNLASRIHTPTSVIVMLLACFFFRE